MKSELLKLIKCPNCGGDFIIDEIYRENNGEIIDGYIKCECSEYPILYGILILKNSPMTVYIKKYLKNKNFDKAHSLPFAKCTNNICRAANFIESWPIGGFLREFILSILMMHQKSIETKLSFWDSIGNNSYEIYLRHRFSSQTFWSLYPFIPLLLNGQKRVLDLCCGAGHSSFIISNYIKPRNLISVDGSFRSLYLAKKYFSNTEYINIDANYPLPFKNNIFSLILMMDAFHYIDTRAQLAKEIERILDREGAFLLLHLHNALVDNVAAGKPLSPETWKSLFSSKDVKILPEDKIIEDFLMKDRLDMNMNYNNEDLNSSNALIAVKGLSLGCHKYLWKDIVKFKDNLVINPIYDIKEKKAKLVLERKFPSSFFRKEYPLTEKYLPMQCEIDKCLFSGRHLCTSDSEKIDNLMRKFVIINVPAKYKL